MSPPRAVILSASWRSSGRLRRRLVGIEARLFEQVLVIEERRDVGVERHAIDSFVERCDHHVAGARRLQFRQIANQVGKVDELPRLFELRGVDEVHPHQIGNVAGRDRLRELGHHLRVRDIGEIDMPVREFGVPHLDQLVDHVLVAAAAFPHDQVGRVRRRGRGQEAKRSQAEDRAFQGSDKRH